MTFDEWISIGISNNWCGAPVCETHDGLPMSEAEEQELWDEGNDLCIHIVRLYAAPTDRPLIEANHSPSVWRNIYGV